MEEAQIPDAMAEGLADACAAWSPETIKVSKQLGQDAVTIANNNDFVEQVTFPSSFAATEEFYQQKKEVLVRFSRALPMAQNYRAPNIQKVARLVAQQCGLEEQLVEDTVGRGDWLTGEFIVKGLADGTVKSYYQNQQTVFLEAGIFKKSVPVENYVLLDVMEQAAADAAASFEQEDTANER